jgi:hypothetical protein
VQKYETKSYCFSYWWVCLHLTNTTTSAYKYFFFQQAKKQLPRLKQMCICAYVHMCICAYVHMCICAYVHMYVVLFDQLLVGMYGWVCNTACSNVYYGHIPMVNKERWAYQLLSKSHSPLRHLQCEFGEASVLQFVAQIASGKIALERSSER